MTTIPKHAIITSFLGKTKDRFHEYNVDTTLEERFQKVASIDGFSGVEVVFPYEVSSPQNLLDLTAKYELGIAAVNVNIKAEPEFRDGGLISNDAAVRAKAIQFIKDAKDFATAVGATQVSCCPLGDGYEFNFHIRYAQAWKYMADGFAEAASYKPEIPLMIEYKPAETRGRCLIDTASKTLNLIHDIGLDQLGVTIDYGHAVMFGNENAAEALCLVAERGVPYYIHINDNDGRWDWDYMVGVKHLLGYIEFLYYLQEYEYDGYFTSDTSPTRWDIGGMFEANSRLTNKIWARLNQIDRAKFGDLIYARDYIKTWQFIEKEIFSF